MTRPVRADAASSEAAREAEIATAGDAGHGACLYLTAADLDALGINPEHADAVTYHVDETGNLIVEPATGGEES